MYFSTSQTGNQNVAPLVNLSLREFGAHLIDDAYAHVPFESVVAAIAKAKPIAPELAARELVAHAPDYRAKAFRVGVEEIVRAFGNDERAMQFYRSVASERSQLRFESIGGVSDDLVTVKTRLAAHAANAYWARQHDGSAGLIPAEREYVDLMKSVRQSLEASLTKGKVSADLAETAIAEIEAASVSAGFFGMEEVIRPLQETARDEIYTEHMERVLQRYTNAPGADGPALE
ncbi:hypothetical protein LA345_37370 (plasmid) [Burkholderia vietnamiensis]|uniref:Uncharacterized protein n=1 Tax=Burkholderia vietnamiensis (strain G4 / LMG 22486) TaxID=269482 RepID=A4JVJ6_BURVG|nr:hypothetical protein Bcep1808_7422 [Burkholderia vietnamiensis G4]MCB4349487.1 hypothetical protein [Burkholderia vietnamiensis]